MTIQSTVNDGITYSGNDSATTFAFPFKVDLNTQIEVIIRDALGVETTAVLNTDYTVAGFTVEGSGVVTYPISGDPLATGKKITIKPKMDYLQSTDIRNQGRFAPEIHENAFDTLMMHIKELKGEINRTIQFKKSSEITGAEFGADPEDGKIVAWDGTTGKTKNVVAVDSALVTTFWETILAYTTAASSRTGLDAEQIINSLTAITTLQDADQFGVADNSDSDNSKKITFQNLAKALINGLTAITTLQDTDQISVADNSDSDNSKKITIANLKTALGIAAASTSAAGIVELLTNAELSAGTDTTRAATAANILSLFSASSQASSGYARIPINVGGSFDEIILQWGPYTLSSSQVVFPITFPNAVFQVYNSIKDCTFGAAFSPNHLSTKTWTTSGFYSQITTNAIGASYFYLAIGY